MATLSYMQGRTSGKFRKRLQQELATKLAHPHLNAKLSELINALGGGHCSA